MITEANKHNTECKPMHRIFETHCIELEDVESQ